MHFKKDPHKMQITCTLKFETYCKWYIWHCLPEKFDGNWLKPEIIIQVLQKQ